MTIAPAHFRGAPTVPPDPGQEFERDGAGFAETLDGFAASSLVPQAPFGSLAAGLDTGPAGLWRRGLARTHRAALRENDAVGERPPRDGSCKGAAGSEPVPRALRPDAEAGPARPTTVGVVVAS